MKWFRDMFNNEISLADETEAHYVKEHSEMSGEIDRIRITLLYPDRIIRSPSDYRSIAYYRYFDTTPVTSKYLCVVVKILINEKFISTAYFRPTIQRGEILWTKK